VTKDELKKLILVLREITGFRKYADLPVDRAGNCSSEPTSLLACLPAFSSLSRLRIVPDLGGRCDRFPARSRHSVFSIQTWHEFLPASARAKRLSLREGLSRGISIECVNALSVIHEKSDWSFELEPRKFFKSDC